MKLIIICLLIFLTYILNKEKFVNQKVVIRTSFFLISLVFLILSILFALYYLIFLNDNQNMIFRMASYTLLILAPILIILIIVIAKDTILGGFRIVNYWINRRNILKNGDIQLGTITDVVLGNIAKIESRWKEQNIYYLIVDLNGEKIKSLYFGNSYYNMYCNEIKKIEVITYNNKKYVKLLKTTI